MLNVGVAAVFFCCFFIFLLRHIDPAVILSSNGLNIHNYVSANHALEATPQDTAISIADPWFRQLFVLELTPEYLRHTVVMPGGITRLAVTLCIYSCHHPIAGALAFTLLALFLCWIFVRYVKAIGAPIPFALRFIPAFFMITMCAWYEGGYLRFLLPIAGALALAAIYLCIRPATTLVRTLLLTAFFWFAWYVMLWGCFLVLLFVVMHNLLSRKHDIASLAVAAGNGALLYLLDTWMFPLDKTIRWYDFMELSGLPLVVIGYFPFVAFIMTVAGRFRRFTEKMEKPAGVILQTLLLIGCTAFAAIWLFRDPVNRDTRTIARTSNHIKNGQWEKILHENTATLFANFPQKAGALQLFMVHAVDHALCRTGQIGERLFSFPQAAFTYDPLLMLENTYMSGHVNSLAVLNLTMNLGMLNCAEKIAGELMEKMGPYPDIIYCRALVQIAKGNRDAASTYLGKLAGMPFYRTKAQALLDVLDQNGSSFPDARIASMRANMDTIDYYLFNNTRHDAELRNLLQSNPANKAAYDYLMTYSLITGQLDNIAALTPAAPAFGYTTLPRCWEEAQCLYQTVKAQQNPAEDPFSGLQKATIERFNNFSQAWLDLESDPDAAAKLAPAFGDSYFFFSIFRYSRGAHHE